MKPVTGIVLTVDNVDLFGSTWTHFCNVQCTKELLKNVILWLWINGKLGRPFAAKHHILVQSTK